MSGMVTEYKVVFARRTVRRLSGINTTDLEKSVHLTRRLNEELKRGWRVKQMTSTSTGDNVFYAILLEMDSGTSS